MSEGVTEIPFLWLPHTRPSPVTTHPEPLESLGRSAMPCSAVQCWPVYRPLFASKPAAKHIHQPSCSKAHQPGCSKAHTSTKLQQSIHINQAAKSNTESNLLTLSQCLTSSSPLAAFLSTTTEEAPLPPEHHAASPGLFCVPQ